MLEQTPREQRQQLIDTNHSELSLRQQCELLKINRSTLYYKVGAVDTGDINLLNEMREIWEKYPFYGYRRITKELVFKGYEVNRKRVQRLMRLVESKRYTRDLTQAKEISYMLFIPTCYVASILFGPIKCG